MTTSLGGKTFVTATGPGRKSEDKTAAKEVRNFIKPAPVAAAASAENELHALQALLRMQTAAKSFSPPSGHFDWGMRLYQAGLEVDVCRNDAQINGWYAASKEKGNVRE